MASATLSLQAAVPCLSSTAKASRQSAVSKPQSGVRGFGQNQRSRKTTLLLRAQQAPASAPSAADASQAPLPALPALDGSYEDKCRFSDYANWLIPGALLVGRYPHVEPSRCTHVEQGEKQLRELLEAGVRVFISLQKELPDQDQIKIGGVAGFLPYKATAQLIAAAMSEPPTIEEVAALRTPELDKFLPPRRSGKPNLAATRHRLELEFLHVPVPDLGLPKEDELSTLIGRDIEPRLRQAVAHNGEGVVYLHCWGGRGRVGTAAACLLAQLYGLSADEALERVQRAFDTRQDEGRASPETPEQVEFVKSYAAALRK